MSALSCRIASGALHILCAEGTMKERDAAELAWELFEKTGSLTYYMLYKKLKR